MKNVKPAFVNAVHQRSRHFKFKLDFGDFVLENLESVKTEGVSCDSSGLTLGTAAIGTGSFEGRKITQDVSGKIFRAFIGLDINGTIEWCKLGKYTVTDVKTVGNTTTAEFEDDIAKLDARYDKTTLAYPALATDVLSEIASLCGVSFDTSNVPSDLTIDSLAGYTCREAVSFIAQLLGCFVAVIPATEKIGFKWYTDTGYSISTDNNLFMIDEPTCESEFTLEMISCAVDDNILTAGTGTAGLVEIENPLMTQVRLDSVYKSVKDLTYNAGKIPFVLGNPLLDVWDIVTVTYKDKTFKVPCMHISCTYEGGFKCDVEAYVRSSDTDFEGGLSKQLGKLKTEIKVVSGEVSSKVSRDDLISEINQSPEAIKITASMIDLQGAVTADDINVTTLESICAKIGGFTIGATYIANNTTALAGAANSVYLGTNGISCGTNFKVTKAGALTATSGTIGGFTIGATTLKSSGGGYTSVLACYNNDSSTSRVMHCYAGDDPNNDTFRILRDGTVISGGSNNQVRMKEGHLDFYYGDAYSGRLGQSADNKITIEGTHLQLDAGKYLYGDGLQLIGTSTSGHIAIGKSSQSGHVFVYSGAGDIRLVSGNGYRTRIYSANDSGNVQVASWWQNGLTLVNGKSILGTSTSNSAINLVQMSAANNVIIGSSSQPGNTNIYCNSTTYTKFYVGTDNIASVTVAGLQFKNESGIVLNGKIALRYYNSKVYCGADTEPLVLIGSSLSFSGTISELSVGALTATSAAINGTLTAKAATINGSLTAAGATINGTATVNGLTVNGGVTAYSLTTTYGVTCASLTTSGNVALDNNKYVTAKNTSGTAYNILGINSAGHATFGSSSLAGNSYVMCKDGYYVNLRVGSVNVVAVDSSGLLMPNDMMIMCGTASSHVNAIRLKTTEIGVGYASIPLKLVGSAVTSNGSAVTSDRRLKTDINPLGDKYAKLIDKLPAVNYRYTTHRQNVVNCGFIAQDVLAALSEVGLTADEFGGFVDVYGDGREFALDYTQFVPILWEQIKTLKAKIKTLEEVNL